MNAGPVVQVCEDREETEAAYAAAEAAGEVYLAVERGGDSWGVVYDLLPANRSLDADEVEKLRAAVTEHVEDRVRATGPTEEVGHGVGAEMGSLHGFGSREDAEHVAEIIADAIGSP
jgi:hypothetical protein